MGVDGLEEMLLLFRAWSRFGGADGCLLEADLLGSDEKWIPADSVYEWRRTVLSTCTCLATYAHGL